MGRRGVWPELTSKLLLTVHQPTLTTGLLRRWVDGSVLEGHALSLATRDGYGAVE